MEKKLVRTDPRLHYPAAYTLLRLTEEVSAKKKIRKEDRVQLKHIPMMRRNVVQADVKVGDIDHNGGERCYYCGHVLWGHAHWCPSRREPNPCRTAKKDNVAQDANG